MAYDLTKLTRLRHLQALAQKVKTETDALSGRISTLEAVEYTIEKAADSGSYSAVYNLKKNGSVVGASINIPKDMVVQSGSVVTLAAGNGKGEGGADLADGTYIKLVLANSDNSEIYIPVDSLIEYVTSGSASGDMVVVAVSDDHKVTATISDGTVTKAKLHADVQATLDRVVDASAVTAGLMSAAHYSKLEAISSEANKVDVSDTTAGDGVITVTTDGTAKDVTVYTLPTASASVLGGVKIGDNIDIAEGVISVADASASVDGLMSSAHFSKVEGVSNGANKVTVATEGSGAIEIDGASKAVVNIASDEEVTSMLTEVFGA